MGSDAIAIELTEDTEVGFQAKLLPLELPRLYTEYEAVRSRFQVDVQDLSMLTNFNVGRPTIAALSADPSRLRSLLGFSQWSYLQFVPSRYGRSHCLTAATDCLLARIQGILMPERRNEAKELRLHVAALTSLQDSLDDAYASLTPETLCASQLLGLHALLNPSEGATWANHTRGSISLIKHRSPSRFKHDFDKALFLAHIGPIVFDSLMSHSRCYIAEPEWMELYQSLDTGSDTLTERSSLAISIRSLMIRLPNLWHDIDSATKGPGLFDEKLQTSLNFRCQEMHQALVSWMEDYKTYCARTSVLSPSDQELSVRRELYGTALECLIVVKRLFATVSVDQSPELESDVQALVQSLLDLQKQPGPKHSWLFMGHEMGVTQGVLLTRSQWQCFPFYSSPRERKLAVRERYIDWVEKLQPRW
ncbi:hypothetical protein N7468_010244 [Penicillium chermesinum]|uniref:Uncharacterized protein n=1 Tax=Penicillium chermesinum TaxID=63820 RepID=A0A9W9TCA0_9EURO|nr:uncharacterized protein N7468_010244 [Penicillium chermesinum]KAJ5217236.1 hypothetical protein N7468_010244 [Penicillium chermesinum]